MKKHLMIKLVISLMIISCIATTAVMAMDQTTSSTTNEVNVSNSADTDSIDTLLNNNNFINHGMKISVLNEDVKITKEDALKNAQKEAGDEVKNAKKITAVKCRFTDTNNVDQRLPGKDFVFKDYPVWIVTFYNVTMQKLGPAKPERIGNPTVVADYNSIIDANTGEELMAIAYSVK